MFSGLNGSFVFGCVLLLCVAVAVFSNAVGYSTGVNQAYAHFEEPCVNQEPVEEPAEEPTEDSAKEQVAEKAICCENCNKKDTLITRLRNELAKAQQRSKEVREKRLELRLRDLQGQLAESRVHEHSVMSAEDQHKNRQQTEPKCTSGNCKQKHRSRILAKFNRGG